jgi:TRAP-type uncharacterized transport system substrate-binding protein
MPRTTRCKGEDKFKGNKVPVRTLMVLYPNRMHLVAIDGKGIAKFADLKGKRVSTGSPGSATEVMAFRLIEAAGMDKDKDLKRERLGAAESVNAMKDGKIDAFFWVGRPADRRRLRPGQHARHQDQDGRPRRPGARHEQEVRQPVRAGRRSRRTTYKGMDTDNHQATVQNILVAADSMDEKTAYNIVKAVFDHKPTSSRCTRRPRTSSWRTRRRTRRRSLAPRRAQVLRRKGHQAQLTA